MVSWCRCVAQKVPLNGLRMGLPGELERACLDLLDEFWDIAGLRYCVLPALGPDVEQHDGCWVAAGISSKHFVAAVAAQDHQARTVRCGWEPRIGGIG